MIFQTFPTYQIKQFTEIAKDFFYDYTPRGFAYKNTWLFLRGTPAKEKARELPAPVLDYLLYSLSLF